MVLQNDGLSITKMLGNTLSLLTIKDDASKLWVYGVVLVESQAVLGDHVELSAEDAEGLAIDAVCVA